VRTSPVPVKEDIFFWLFNGVVRKQPNKCRWVSSIRMMSGLRSPTHEYNVAKLLPCTEF
jgi:hypothetical protein